jgi:hypothetical protein
MLTEMKGFEASLTSIKSEEQGLEEEFAHTKELLA